MTQKTYARIQAGAVVELLHTSAAITALFHPSLQWVEVTDPSVRPGWLHDAHGFAAPPAATAAGNANAVHAPSLAQLQAQVSAIAAQLAALQAAAPS